MKWNKGMLFSRRDWRQAPGTQKDLEQAGTRANEKLANSMELRGCCQHLKLYHVY